MNEDLMDTGLGMATEPIDPATPAPVGSQTRERPRKSKYKIDKAKVAQRVINFYDNDDADRAIEIENHLQRYAKYRMWTEGKDWPWENASDAAIPDMMTHSLKVQDTLHNAVMSSRPSVIAKAINSVLKKKEETVNNLLDYQFFVENKGENLIGELADQFVNTSAVTVFVPWITEEREAHEIRTLPMIPRDSSATVYFQQAIQAAYPTKLCRPAGNDDWTWEILDNEDKPNTKSSWLTVEFYTVGSGDHKRIEMDITKMATVFNGPRPIIKSYEQIVAPARSANLQIPSPSNPGGAAHVVMVDYPTIDEIRRLVKSGFYDLVDDKDLEKLGMATMDTTTGQYEEQEKDALQGVTMGIGKNDTEAKNHKTLTRYTCFDIFDLDGDGVDEDVVWWVIKEEEILLRARELTQVYPYTKPQRPFAEGSFLPVVGRRSGISLLEMMEGLHDVIKQFTDQTIDGGTLANVPFGFYRASSNMRPETMRLWPGEMYPLSDPKNDVSFPQMQGQGSAFGFNLVTMFGQWEEKLTNIGDLQLGRVPQGKSSALRTARGMNAVMGQGDARPERILRRFFMLISDIYKLMHESNKVFLPKDKQVRLYGIKKPGDDPYLLIPDVDAIRGEFEFEFTANAMNTSKEALQESLQDMMGTYLNPLALQAGVVDADGMYQLLRDWGKAKGQDPDKYLKPPTPESMLPKIYAEEALTMILQNQIPEGRPAEDAQAHLQKIMDFAQSDQFGLLSESQVHIFKGYIVYIRQQMEQAMRQQQMMQAAAASQQGQPGTPGPQGTAPINTAQAPLQTNELMDESMPGAGGGGNP